MKVRIGLPKTSGAIALAARRANLPVLVSAGSLWDLDRQAFRPPGMLVIRMEDVALDSAGFVRGLSGYPWTVPQYVGLAAWGCFSWWSQIY